MNEGTPNRVENNNNERGLPETIPHCEPVPTPEGFDCKRALRALGFSLAMAGAAGPSFATNESEYGAELREKAIIESVFNEQTLAQLEAAGFIPVVQLESSGEAGYIVHLGQTHEDPTSDFHAVMNTGISGSFQERLNEFLPDLVNEHGGVVFVEGVATDLNETKETIISVVDKMQVLADDADGPDSVQAALTIQNYLNWYGKHASNRLVRNYFPSELSTTLQGQIDNFIANADQIGVDEHSDFELLVGYSELNQAVTFGPTGFSSADIYGYMHDKFEIYPAETPQQNERGIEAMRKLDDARKAYKEVEQDLRPEYQQQQIELLHKLAKSKSALEANPDDILLQNAVTQIEAALMLLEEVHEQALAATPEAEVFRAAEEEFAAEGYLAREQVIYDRIAEYEANNVPLENPIVVYGSGHELAYTLMLHNQNNEPDRPDRGLIKIEQIKTNNE